MRLRSGRLQPFFAIFFTREEVTCNDKISNLQNFINNYCSKKSHSTGPITKVPKIILIHYGLHKLQ